MSYCYKNKAANVRLLNRYMLAKTLSMFEYENLPETLPAEELEKMLQETGSCFVAKFNGDLYCFTGGRGGKQDAYGNHKTYIVSNPHLNFNAELEIGKDGVLVKNDSQSVGLLPLFERGNTFLAENDVNMMIWGYNSRVQKLISASDDRTKQSAELYVKHIIDGEISIVGENAMFDGVKVQGGSGNGNSSVKDMIEFQQYIKATMFNEVGISSNFNMKRERLISSELDAAEDSLFPLVYNMMQERLNAVDAINEMFGTDIKVDFGSVWAFKNKELVDGKTGNGVIDEQRSEEQPVNVGDEADGSGDTGQDPQPEQEQDRELERERSIAQAPESEPGSDLDADELQAIINNPDSSPEDVAAAEELLEEMEND